MNSFAIMSRSRRIIRSTLVLIIWITAVLILAAPGDLDTSFDLDGKVTTEFNASNDFANAVALQSDGMIVAAGYTDFSLNGTFQDFSLARYDTTGTLDPGFGTGGKVTTEISSDLEHGEALVIQPDGKIILAGQSFDGTNEGFALVRYDTGGTPDPLFGTAGKVTTDFSGGIDGAYAVALQADGKIVTAGFTQIGANIDFALARYDSGGILDPAFGVGGKMTTDFVPGSLDVAFALIVQPDQKIVAAGFSGTVASHEFALARYNSDGTPDTTFNTTGTVTTGFNVGLNQIHGLLIQPDNKIVAAGTAPGAGNQDFALARYNADGSLDIDFDGDGKVLTKIGLNDDQALDVVLQPDGKLIAGGYTQGAVALDFALARYNTDGSPDPSFEGDGIVITDIGGLNDTLTGLAVQPGDRQIVAAGYSQSATSIDYAVARYDNPPTKNLIINGGFEAADEASFPTDWKGKNLTGDKRIVNKPDKTVANAGNAAFQFKGGVGENSQLSQKPDLADADPAVGDLVAIQAFINGKKAVGNGMIIAVLKYADVAVEKTKLTLTVPEGTYVYTALASSSAAVTAAVQKVKVKIVNNLASGRFRIDDVNLTLTKATPGAVLPLPSGK